MRRSVVKVLAAVAILVAALLTQLPGASSAEADRLSQRFSFAGEKITSIPVDGMRTVRVVRPEFRHIAGWISAVGAAVTLTDLDADGLDNDVCLVDPRTDTVTVSPAPGTPARFRPFVLDPAPRPYDRSTMAPMGCLPGDFNADGAVDLLQYYWGRSPILFLRDTGRPVGPDAFVRKELLDRVEHWATDSITSADVDGDGHADLIVGNYFPDNQPLLGNGAEPVNLANSMPSSMSYARNGGRNRLFLWQDGRFVDASGAFDPESAHAWTLAVGAQDLNGDMLPELYFANDFGPDRLLLNRSRPGQPAFTELFGSNEFGLPKSKVLGRDSFKGMGVDFADMNGDGRTDIFVSNLAAEFGLVENHFAYLNNGRLTDMWRGVAPFDERGDQLGVARSGWAWDAKFGDFDNDGVPELTQTTGFLRGSRDVWPQIQELATSNDQLLSDVRNWPDVSAGTDISGDDHDAFFVRGSDGRWADVAERVGFGSRDVTRGVATADVDGDGRLDAAVAGQFADSVLYRNTAKGTGDALSLRLVLPPGATGADTTVHSGRLVSGSPAIGAQATVVLPDGRRVLAQVDGGNGHASVRGAELHFGLGRVAPGQQVQVELTWRDRKGQVHTDTVRLAPGRHVVVLGQGGRHG